MSASRRGRPSTKTGCGTCRIRRVKCDESKPFCQKCVTTGRTCDGYQLHIRQFMTPPASPPAISVLKQNIHDPSTNEALTGEIPWQEIDLLNRSFSTKSLLDVSLNCTYEATLILQESRKDRQVRSAVQALRILRADLETAGNEVHQTPNYDRGIELYNLALQGVIAGLAARPSPHMIRSALFCSHLFVSIEQALGNYAAMVQHIVRGLDLLHEYRSNSNASRQELPQFDVFLIKLFSAPSKFPEQQTPSEESQKNATESPNNASVFRAIAPNMRDGLIDIASSILALLNNLSKYSHQDSNTYFPREKIALFNRLGSWYVQLEWEHDRLGRPQTELVAVTFLRIFHAILSAILFGTLNSSHEDYAKRKANSDRLQDLANVVDERLQNYRTVHGMRISHEEMLRMQ